MPEGASKCYVVILEPERTNEQVMSSAAAQSCLEWQVKLELNPERLGKSHSETAPLKRKARHGCREKKSGLTVLSR